MLQSVEYQARPYLAWLWRTQDFTAVMRRRALDATRAARLLRFGSFVGMLAQLLLGLVFIVTGCMGYLTAGVWFGLAVIASYPLVWAHVLAVVVAVGHMVFVKSREKTHAAQAQAIFSNHTAVRIAVAGSYGKTSMKEMLLTVLRQGKKVAATPANMNVISSHARFARSLDGDEDIVIVEFGEGKPGDVERFTTIVQPTHAVVTGLAPAHLDTYKTLAAAGADIFSVAAGMPKNHVYVNAESAETAPFTDKSYQTYDRKKALGWTVKNAKTGLDGTSFELVKGAQRLKLHSQLIGLHQVGPLSCVAVLALELGLDTKQITAGISETKPFEHRMQPYALGGAWVIDDTYNGNLEGIRAGTELLALSSATRKIYVTPGLVDQGKDSDEIHREVGRLIAVAKPDVVVLMQNSVTTYIQAGLNAAGFKGEVSIQSDPLEFYQNLGSFVASGDVVLMQNDWTDNYR